MLDEADEMLDLGFADELDAIFEALPGHVQTALFSATLPPRIAKIADEHLENPERISIAREETPEGEAPRVPQIAYVVPRNYRTAALGRILDLEDPELAIIFARTRNEVDELTEALRVRGYSVEALHGGLDQPTRDRVMRRARAGQLDAIVATDVAARGLDIKELPFVINYDVPYSAEDYVHRIGRTGRAGSKGVATMLATPEDKRLVEAIEALTKQTFKPIAISPMPRNRRNAMSRRRDQGYVERVDTPEDERLARERARAYVPPAQRHRDPIFDMPYIERNPGTAKKADEPLYLERREKRRPVAALLGGTGH